MFRELVIDGVLIAPLVTYAALAFLMSFVLRAGITAAGLTKYLANPGLAHLSLYVASLGLLILLM